MKNNRIFILLIIILIVINGVLLINKDLFKKERRVIVKSDDEVIDTIVVDANFNMKLIKTVNSTLKSNYLISPYSIEIALNMLKEGATSNTYTELNNLVNRKINDISGDKVKIANAIFVKNMYKDYMEKQFYDNLKNKYNSEILYDEFKTPDVINNWVNKNTDGMIPSILNGMDPDFVLGLANAVAIDVKWYSPFECINTQSKEFTKNDGSKINVQMMHNSYENEKYKYFDFDSIKGIILPYENNLEFVGIMPNNIDEFINNLSLNKLNDIDKNAISASDKLHIFLSLPRFSYSFDLENFKSILKSMGINDVFNANKASLTNIIKRDNLNKLGINNIYVSDAIHKTYIDLNEEGTKAAAVTYFGIKANAMMPKEYKEVNIDFNRPFIYMIRDNKNKEILFFGVVYEPNIWNGSTCDKKN